MTSPGATRWIPVLAVAAAVSAGYLAWARSHSVDATLVGRWTKATASRTGSLQGTFVIGGDRHYEIETRVQDRGRLVASNGRFRMTSSSSETSAAGSYRVLDPMSLEVTSALGKVVWMRTNPAPAAPPGAPMVGRWEAAPIMGGVVWHQTIDVQPDSTYTLASVTADSGRITTSRGAWRMVTQSGHASEGTYRVDSAQQQLVFTAAGGRSTWRRLRSEGRQVDRQ